MHEEKCMKNRKTTRKPGIYRKAHGVSMESLMITDVGSALESLSVEQKANKNISSLFPDMC